MGDLSGLTVLITGAAGGIGEVMAERFAAAGAHGWRLSMCGPRATLQHALVQHTKALCWTLKARRRLPRTVAAIGDTMGIDILINNAGLGIVFPAGEVNLAAWDSTMRINSACALVDGCGSSALP